MIRSCAQNFHGPNLYPLPVVEEVTVNTISEVFLKLKRAVKYIERYLSAFFGDAI
jgi:hypothetical protein